MLYIRKAMDSIMRISQRCQRVTGSLTLAIDAKAKEMKQKGIDVVGFGAGEPDFDTPEHIRKAAKDALDLGKTRYTPAAGMPELRQAICDKLKRDNGLDYVPQQIVVSNGAKHSLFNSFQALLEEGDEVIVPEPFYPNYHTFITTAGGVIHPLHTKPEEGYFYADRARIEACITPKTKAIMITNPGNPTGTCLTEAQMKMLLDVAVAHDLYLVADEVYREFTYDGEPLHSFGKFDYGQENLILIDSVSKRFSACGARIGCLISRNREFMANALKYCQARLSVATLDQIAAAALYSVGPEYFEQVRQEYKRRRDTVVRKLHEIPGVICECPRGAFYLMAALPVDDAEKFQLWLLQEFEDCGDTVMFSAGEPFYATPGKGRNEIRIAYVLKQEDLERAMDLLALGIRKYNETH